MKAFRFIHTDLKENQIPVSNVYPQTEIKCGAQVLNCTRTFSILFDGYDRQDDWYDRSEYTYIAILDVSGFNGDSALSYKSVVESDIIEMRVIDLYEAELIARENDIDDLEGILWKKAKKVIPQFIDTLKKEIIIDWECYPDPMADLKLLY